MISLDARGIQLEPGTAILVTKRVENKRDLVRSKVAISVQIQELIPARQNRTHTSGAQGVEHPGSDVNRVRVVENANLCLLAPRPALIGNRLDELCNGSRRGPGGFVE